jgi:hypothetical protein
VVVQDHVRACLSDSERDVGLRRPGRAARRQRQHRSTNAPDFSGDGRPPMRESGGWRIG